jgi:agmatinase
LHSFGLFAENTLFCFGVTMTDNPLFQSPNSTPQTSSEASRAVERESQLPLTGWQQEVTKGLEYGLEAADSIRDRSIPTFSRGELPH